MNLHDARVHAEARYTELDQREEAYGWVCSMLNATEDFPDQARHSPAAFLEAYKQIQPEAYAICPVTEDDFKRFYGIYLLSIDETYPLALPDEWVIIDLLTVFMFDEFVRTLE